MSQPGVLNLRVIGRMTALVAVLLGFLVFSGVRASAVPGGDFPDGLTFGGLQRNYLVHVPPGLEQPTGLVINLHGAGMTGGAQAAMTNYNAVADQHGFVVVYPDGIDFSWADGRGASVPDRQGVDDVGFLVALADRLTQDFGIDRGPGVRHRNVGGRIHGQPAGVSVAQTSSPPSPRLRDAGLRVPVQSVATRVRPEVSTGRPTTSCRSTVARWWGGAGRATSCPHRRWRSGGAT